MGRERELAYGQCRVCGSEVIADDRGRMDREWSQARTVAAVVAVVIAQVKRYGVVG
jgi:hypothetical protein